MSLASAIEPLRALNRLYGREAYQWRLASLDGSPVAASNGIAVPALRAEEALADADYLFVCGGLHVEPAEERRLSRAPSARCPPRRLNGLAVDRNLSPRAGGAPPRLPVHRPLGKQ